MSALLNKGETAMNIVIQGAGRGIGLALANHALASGATHLFLTAQNPEQSAGYQELPPSATISWVAMDFLNPDSIAIAGDTILASQPNPDRIITTAGVLHDGDLQPEKRVGALSADAMLRLYQINAMGPVLFFKSLWPALRRAHPVVAASISARVGSISDNRLGGWYSYRASKAALNQYLRTLSIELARYNPEATVVTLHPGTVATNLSAPFRTQLAKGQLQSPEECAARLWSVLDQVSPNDSGSFFAYDGQPIPY
ncbi:MAG: SDR family NAD(P)-dependent oxidoreductase [Proteobacteria bacterium]|nr:SDR family NAD(P)-dependent oxidoreductase [Pseudomonadota bacterium]MDA0960957.1 SDR family NAD(P)-dependent oxidoreductase [Pseudomonadota bacterium]MDA1152292.1 SDR family NAD(P)-dependent oxidoreductase [Pseudomonadota bacterium]